MNNKVIDLFAGVGGFSVGFEKAGFFATKAVEFDKQIAAIYEINHPNTELFIDDIGNINNSSNFSENEVDVIIGGPPCQGFSMAGARIRQNSFVDDPRNYLFKQYLKVVQIVKPKVFIIENVKGILSMNNGDIFKEIIKVFSDSENFGGDRYYLHYKVVKGVEFGIPQKRERVIIIGRKNADFDFEQYLELAKKAVLTKYPNFYDRVTLRDAISNLPEPSENGIVSNPSPESDYQKFLACSGATITNHNRFELTKKALDRVKQIKPGQNFTALKEEIHSVHSGSYGRLEWDGVAPTITTRFDTPSGGQFIHPSEDRMITPREAARIQSFPDDFVFEGTKSIVCKTIGNAVPPKIAYTFAFMVKELLKDER